MQSLYSLVNVYNPSLDCYLMCPEKLSRYIGGVYSNISDQTIEKELKEKTTHKDKDILIIISTIKLIIDRIFCDILYIYSDSTAIECEIDGNIHMLRAYEYVKKYINPGIMIPVKIFYSRGCGSKRSYSSCS